LSIDDRGKIMKGSFRAVTAAILAFCGAAAPADAAKEGAKKDAAKPRSSLAAIQLECFKQHGAWYDAATKKWVIQGSYYHMASRIDAVNSCVTQRTGKTAPFIREQTSRP